MLEIDSQFRRPLEAALEGAVRYLNALDGAPVGQSVDTAILRASLAKRLSLQGVPADRVIEELIADVEGGIIGSAGGRFYAWVMGGSVPSALAADWLTAAWDQNAAQATSAPAACIAEEIAGEWLKDVLSIPNEASFAFVTGCQMAHVTCLAAARHALLAQRGWDVEERGLYGAPPVRILTSDAHHRSIERAVKLLGMGLGQIQSLVTEDDGTLSAATLGGALRASDAPAIVLLGAGDINTGAFDPFETLIPIVKCHDAWVHIDGAFGLWAAASARQRHFVKGVRLADSWATDGHKMLNVPYDSGYAFIRDARAHRAAMFQPASYIPAGNGGRDPFEWNAEWSRRARGFATYAALRELGRNGIADLVDRCCDNARAIVNGIAAMEGVQLLAAPRFNQGLVRFLDPRSGASEEDHDRYTDVIIEAIVQGGEAFFGGTTWRGRRAMRVSACNWQTTDRDVERTLHSVAKCVRKFHGSRPCLLAT